MKALTLIRPMDWAIIHGGKDVENRVWPCPDSVVGKFICVHSGMKWDQAYEAAIRALMIGTGERWERWYSTNMNTWPGGRIVGVVRVDACREPPFRPPMFQDSMTTDEPPLSPWAMTGQCHWHVSGPIALTEPVTARGAHKLWTVPPDVEAMVRAQLPEGMVFA